MSSLSLIKERYSSLRYPIHKEKGSLLDAFPDLAGIPSFYAYGKSTLVDKVISYIIYMYDKNSEFIKEFRDLEERKNAVANEVGWVKREGDAYNINPNHRSIMRLENTRVNAMIIDYIFLQNDMALTMIHTNEQLFSEYMELLLKPILDKSSKRIDSSEAKIIFSTVDIKKKFREECKQLKEDLHSLYLEVYGDNWDVANKVKEAEIISISPESIGNMMHG